MALIFCSYTDYPCANSRKLVFNPPVNKQVLTDYSHIDEEMKNYALTEGLSNFECRTS